VAARQGDKSLSLFLNLEAERSCHVKREVRGLANYFSTGRRKKTVQWHIVKSRVQTEADIKFLSGY
jgi:hypothetical protein